jgi:hypothetical protein
LSLLELKQHETTLLRLAQSMDHDQLDECAVQLAMVPSRQGFSYDVIYDIADDFEKSMM